MEADELGAGKIVDLQLSFMVSVDMVKGDTIEFDFPGFTADVVHVNVTSMGIELPGMEMEGFSIDAFAWTIPPYEPSGCLDSSFNTSL
jgi:hypothetical protein